MIKSLVVQNFQSHKKTVMKFDPGFNVIVGLSDVGKSALIRAFRWLIWNRPQGERDIRSWWGGRRRVQIRLGRSVVARIRGLGRRNMYVVDGQKLKAIKTDVPAEVTTAVNISEVNFQGQLDRHFLLADSPGAVAQHYNQIAHLSEIDVGLKNVQAWIRVLEQSISADEDRLLELTRALKEFDDLPVFEAQVGHLEMLEVRSHDVQQDRDALSGLLADVRQIECEITKQVMILGQASVVDGLLQLCSERDSLEAARRALQELLGEMETTGKDLKIGEVRLSRLSATFKRRFPSVCPLCGQPVRSES